MAVPASRSINFRCTRGEARIYHTRSTELGVPQTAWVKAMLSSAAGEEIKAGVAMVDRFLHDYPSALRRAPRNDVDLALSSTVQAMATMAAGSWINEVTLERPNITPSITYRAILYAAAQGDWKMPRDKELVVGATIEIPRAVVFRLAMRFNSDEINPRYVTSILDSAIVRHLVRRQAVDGEAYKRKLASTVANMTSLYYGVHFEGRAPRDRVEMVTVDYSDPSDFGYLLGRACKIGDLPLKMFLGCVAALAIIEITNPVRVRDQGEEE